MTAPSVPGQALALSPDPASARNPGASPGAYPGANPGPNPGPGRLTALGWTAERQRDFVEHLAVNGCVSLAAAHVGLSRQSAYVLRDRMPNSVFALAWETAMMLARRKLFDIAMERAVQGREEDVRWRGECVGTRVVHNDRLLMRLLDYRPERIHPTLSSAELHQLWPTMLREIDAILPPVLAPAEIRARLADHRDRGD